MRRFQQEIGEQPEQCRAYHAEIAEEGILSPSLPPNGTSDAYLYGTCRISLKPIMERLEAPNKIDYPG
jgi:hypothetical protein